MTISRAQIHRQTKSFSIPHRASVTRSRRFRSLSKVDYRLTTLIHYLQIFFDSILLPRNVISQKNLQRLIIADESFTLE